MGNKVNYIGTKEAKKINQNKKMGLGFFMMNFHGCVLFIFSQNTYHTVILDHL